MKKRELEIKSGVFNVKVCFALELDPEHDNMGYYSNATKTIVINIQQIYTRHSWEVLELTESTIIHELTHFFDYNGWMSWQYKENKEHEQLATFMELYHQPIQDILVQLRPTVLKILEELKNE